MFFIAKKKHVCWEEDGKQNEFNFNMTIIISPAKKLTPTNNSLGLETTDGAFPRKLTELVNYAKSLSEKDLIDKMKISSSLAQLNFDRFQKFQDKPGLNVTTQAIYSFKRDTYVGLKAEHFTKTI